MGGEKITKKRGGKERIGGGEKVAEGEGEAGEG